MPSFDILSEVDEQELTNAVDQANREVTTRFDFKGTNASFERKGNDITLKAQNDFQLKQMQGILEGKLTKRNIDLRAMDIGKPSVNLNDAHQVIKIKQGIETDVAKKIVKEIKNSKLKVQASIQGQQVRVTGKKRDDLQSVISFLEESDQGLPLQFDNFRD